MKHLRLLKTSLIAGTCMLGAASVSQAQQVHENIIDNLSAARFIVTAPSNIVGLQKITLATWGAQPTPAIIGAQVVKAYDTLAAATLLNGTGSYPSLSGKYALIFRGGGVNFSDKAQRALNAGAAGVIIVNNIPGDPISMGATPATFTINIPVVMVSDIDGAKINNELKAGHPVTVNLGNWSMGATHDLGLVTAYQSAPHALNIPASQMTVNTFPYNHFIGGAVANYGTATETNVMVSDSVFFTPTGGSRSFLTVNSYTIASIAPSDSIKFGFGTAPYSLPVPSGQGRYDHQYTLSYANTDEVPQDNTYSISQYVTDSVFCKGTYDFANHRPNVSLGIQVANGTTPFTMGTMMYVKNGGYGAKQMQYSLSKKNIPTLDAETAWTYLFKWTDGSNGEDLDSFAQVGEMALVGYSYSEFHTGDSSGKTITVDLVDSATSSQTPVLESNSWYWAAVESPNTCYIGMDKAINYYTRSYAQFVAGGSVPMQTTMDHAELALYTDKATMQTNPGQTLINFPFSATTAYGNVFFVDSIFYDKYNEIPAISVLLTKNTLGVSNVKKNIGQVDIYPNPAVNNTTVAVNLDKMSKKVLYKLIDGMGRTVYTETHSNVQNEKLSLNTNGYAAGNYYLFIVTDDGSAVKKISVLK